MTRLYSAQFRDWAPRPNVDRSSWRPSSPANSLTHVRLGVRYEGVIERVGALANRVPVPPGLSMFGMPIAREAESDQLVLAA